MNAEHGDMIVLRSAITAWAEAFAPMMGSKGSATISALSAFQRMVMMMRIIDAHLVQEIADREIA